MCGMIPANEENNVPEKGFTECYNNVHSFAKSIVLPEKCTECRYRYICCVCAASCRSETGEFNRIPTYVRAMTQRVAEYYREYAEKIKGGEKSED